MPMVRAENPFYDHWSCLPFCLDPLPDGRLREKERALSKKSKVPGVVFISKSRAREASG